MIIGITGRKRAGKNLASKLIITHSKTMFIERSFAYDLKKIVSILTGLDAHTEHFKTMNIPLWNITGREFFQKLGTNVVRRLNKNTWLYSLLRKYDGTNWIISDVRFPNEADAIKKEQGIILRIRRPSVEPKKNLISFIRRLFRIGEENHKSETSMLKYKVDYEIVAKNALVLEKEIKIFIKTFKL